MKLIIITIILIIISAWLIYEAEWFEREKLIIGSIIAIGILANLLMNSQITPQETYSNNTFLGAEPSGLLLLLIPGTIFWGLLSIFKIIKNKIKERN